MKQKQLQLLPMTKPYFGGSLDINPKRHIRPLSTKHPLHLVLKAKATHNLFKNKSKIEKIIKKQSETFGIKLYGFSIQKDHIHFNIRIFSREAYKKFIRAITGLIARALKSKGLWKVRPFTRVAKWGKAFQTLKNYILQNELEIKDLIPKQPKRHKYKLRSDLKVLRPTRP